MSFFMQANVAALAAQSNLTANAGLNPTFNQLSSRLKLNSAADDQANTAISAVANTQIASYSSRDQQASSKR